MMVISLVTRVDSAYDYGLYLNIFSINNENLY